MFKILAIGALFTLANAAVDKAVVCINNGDVQGTVTFSTTDQGIRVQGSISGLKEGKHGFHIHEKGDLGGNCTSAGSHFNPDKKDHGAPTDDNRHVGDLGNIVADSTNVANIDFVDKIISLDGTNCIVGRALVIHADEDDLGLGGFDDSKTTGHAGARVACGVVGIA